MKPKQGSSSNPPTVPITIPDDDRVLPVIHMPRVLLEVDAISHPSLIVTTLSNRVVNRESISGRVDAAPRAGVSASIVLIADAFIRMVALDLFAVDFSSFWVAWRPVPGTTEVVHGSSCNSSFMASICFGA